MSGFLEEINSIPNPCFILDENLLEQNMETLFALQEESGVHVLCALKGFAMWSCFPEMMKYITGGTASSLHEVRLINDEMGVKAHSCFVAYDQDEFQ